MEEKGVGGNYFNGPMLKFMYFIYKYGLDY